MTFDFSQNLWSFSYSSHATKNLIKNDEPATSHKMYARATCILTLEIRPNVEFEDDVHALEQAVMLDAYFAVICFVFFCF